MPKKKKTHGPAGKGTMLNLASGSFQPNAQSEARPYISKNAPTAFSEFLRDFRRARGSYYVDNSEEIAAARIAFHQLGDGERAKYDVQAKAEKEVWKQQKEKRDTIGRTLDAVEAEEVERKAASEDRWNHIEEMVNSPSIDELAKTVFVCFSTEYFWCTETNKGVDEVQYFPAEVGCAGFSLSDGLLKDVREHVLIKPAANIPTGFASMVKDQVAIHKIDWWKYPHLEKQLSEVVRRLLLVLRKSNPTLYRADEAAFDRNPPPFFVPAEFRDMAQSVLDYLWWQTPQVHQRVRQINPFKVYELEHLLLMILNRMQKECGPPKQAFELPFIKDCLLSTTYEWYPCLQCFYHANLDSDNETANCALAKANRFAIACCEAACPIFKIELVKGKHFFDFSDPIAATPAWVTRAEDCGPEKPREYSDFATVSETKTWIPAEELAALDLAQQQANSKKAKKKEAKGEKPPPNPWGNAVKTSGNISVLQAEDAEVLRGTSAFGGAPCRPPKSAGGFDASNNDDFPAL